MRGWFGLGTNSGDFAVVTDGLGALWDSDRPLRRHIFRQASEPEAHARRHRRPHQNLQARTGSSKPNILPAFREATSRRIIQGHQAKQRHSQHQGAMPSRRGNPFQRDLGASGAGREVPSGARVHGWDLGNGR